MWWRSWKATGGQTMHCLSTAISTPSLKAQVSKSKNMRAKLCNSGPQRRGVAKIQQRERGSMVREYFLLS